MIWRPWRRQIQSETASLCHLSTHRIGKGRSDAVQDNGRDRNLDKSGLNVTPYSRLSPQAASTQILFIGLAVFIGLGSSLQVSMVAAMGRMRGPLEATWVSLLASLLGMAILLGRQALQRGGLHLPVPFERCWVFTIAGVLFAVSLALAARGIAPYFALTGLLAIPFLIGAGFLGPRLGVGLFLSAVIAGQMTGSVLLDHVGAFGLDVQKVTVYRAVGVVLLIGGVSLIRGVR